LYQHFNYTVSKKALQKLYQLFNYTRKQNVFVESNMFNPPLMVSNRHHLRENNGLSISFSELFRKKVKKSAFVKCLISMS